MPSERTVLPLAEECCSPIARALLDAGSAAALAGILKALAEPTRLRLLSLISAQPEGSMCVCDLTEPVGLSQPTVSHHLKVLVDAGILTREKRGVNAYYGLVPGALDSLAAVLATSAP
ncbi:ArsR/SmtB family transcription factor [Georgenia yuyongxinii]|uniref:Winged helix-turn-helix transcriptional regulator n=1 Tax=Georgenia yuyongxinii TaxID=2589797 RepID=A0A552WW00_9MICO|nr:metalloregulator ArsR/SmtB family transcription factor [Georgenia yuyongxinii]TRW46974.1 winged helix-turn-helix transcriptional regulator [Georgenia yuyongxinii]